MNLKVVRSGRKVPIPDNLSWPQFVFQNFDKYGDSTALVSKSKTIEATVYI